MNKADIAAKVKEVLDCTGADADRAVEAVIAAIIAGLQSDEGQVSIAGLGIFEAKMRKERQGRNPRTGETLTIPAMRVPKFRASKALKDAVK